MLWLPLLLLGSLVSVSALDADIKEDTITQDVADYNLGTVKTKKDTFWSIINNVKFLYTGTMTNDGSTFITATSENKPLQVEGIATTGRLYNNGLLVLNSIEATSGPSSFRFGGATFDNKGTIYLGSASTTDQITTDLTGRAWSNSGTIHVYKDNTTETRGKLNLGYTAALKNTGSICLYNQDYLQTSGISGTGCILASRNTLLELRTNHASADQTIILEDSSTLGVMGAADYTFTVAGFGNGNIIKIGHTITDMAYDAEKGILTLSYNNYRKHFKIGEGYDFDLFEQVSEFAVIYNGPPPEGSTSTSHCLPCEPEFPVAPGTIPKVYTTFIETTVDGITSTAGAVVYVLRDPDGVMNVESIPWIPPLT
ncbi:Hyphally regulated cell wall protein 3, partial [Candida tropicalis]